MKVTFYTEGNKLREVDLPNDVAYGIIKASSFIKEGVMQIPTYNKETGEGGLYFGSNQEEALQCAEILGGRVVSSELVGPTKEYVWVEERGETVLRASVREAEMEVYEVVVD